jgi:hypothetical protein
MELVPGHLSPHEAPEGFNEVEMGTIGGQEHLFEALFVGLPKLIQLGGGVCRGIVHHHKPKGLRIPLDQKFQVDRHFLMALAFVNGVQALSGGIKQASKQRTPGILDPGGIHLPLLPEGNPSVPHIGTPMEVCGIEEDQISAPGGNGQVRLHRIVTGQGALQAFFFKVSTRSRFTVYNGSGEVTFSFPRFHRKPIRFSRLERVDCATSMP